MRKCLKPRRSITGMPVKSGRITSMMKAPLLLGRAYAKLVIFHTAYPEPGPFLTGFFFLWKRFESDMIKNIQEYVIL